MATKKPPLSLRRPAEPIDPMQADRFVHRVSAGPAPAPSVQASNPPDVQASGGSKSLVYRKRTDDLRRRMTIYLSEDLSRRLRLYAAEKDQDYSVVLAEALNAHLDRKGVR
jgi:hypothetical protein